MTKKEVRDYITKEIVKVLADLEHSYTGNMRCSYQDKRNSITLTLRSNNIILFIALDVDNVAAFTSYVSRVVGKDRYQKLSEKKGNIYWYNGGHTKTDIKRYLIQKFSKEVNAMLDIFKGEIEKERKKNWV